ncbi:MAG: hypothetical protein AABW48_06080 [Nanoarchaeota archaeon]
MTQPKYYGYQVPDSGTCLIGTEKDQIVNTLSYYKHQRGQGDIVLPTLEDIFNLGEINITAVFPMAKVDDNISAEVREKVYFHVNANAFGWMQKVAQDYEKLKRADLYKFQTLPLFGLLFLPEDIMQGIRDYDWKQHEAQVRSWLGQREEVLGDLERKGVIARVKPVPVSATNFDSKDDKYKIN